MHARNHGAAIAVLAGTLVAAPARVEGQVARPAPASIALAVDSLARRIVAAGLTPGFGVAVVMDGRTILARNYGLADVTNQVPMDDGTLWYVASTSKSFTGFALSLLAQQGVLDFSQSIASLLPDARWHSGVDPTRLTLASFLSHTHHLNDGALILTSSFTGEIPEAQWPALLRFSGPSGSTDLTYSNLGYVVGGLVIDAKRPEGWRRYLQQAVFAPAGMTETYTRLSGIDRRRLAMPHEFTANGSFVTRPMQKVDATMSGAGGELSTLHDLARWVIVQMDSGVIDGRRVFPAAAVALSHRVIARQTRADARHFAYFDREGWGAGWDIGAYDGEPMISRFGSYESYRSHLSFLPHRRIGVVAQANGLPGGAATDLVAAFAYDLEAGKPEARQVMQQRFDELLRQLAAGKGQLAAFDSVRAARQQPMDHPLRDLAGSYAKEGFGTVTFALQGDSMSYAWGAIRGQVEVYSAARHQMRMDLAGSGIVATFNFQGAGPAASVVLFGETFPRRP